MRRAPIVLGLAALSILASAPSAQAALRGVQLAGRFSYDVGSFGVPGTDDGLGGGVSVRFGLGEGPALWEVGADLDVAGYSSYGDGDPIFQAALSVHRKAFFGGEDRPARAWWSLGAGVGALGIGGSGFALPLRVALGLSVWPRSAVGLELALFNRFTLVLTSGDPSRDFINSTGIELAVRLGR